MNLIEQRQYFEKTKQVYESSKLTFHGVEGYDPYLSGGRGSSLSTVGLFIHKLEPLIELPMKILWFSECLQQHLTLSGEVSGLI